MCLNERENELLLSSTVTQIHSKRAQKEIYKAKDSKMIPCWVNFLSTLFDLCRGTELIMLFSQYEILI